MTIQTFYPVFENGQVLTSASLNDIIDYVEPQDRLTRSRLVGIGVVCGLEADWSGGVLTLSKGVAITSEGYLITEDGVALDRARPYNVPQPDANTATDAEKAEARYPFLFDGNQQRKAWELLPTSFQPAPGEPAPVALSDAFLSDKTVMLFLERSRAALKNCDVNDCSDKGSEMSVTLRRLLVESDTADKILAAEAEIAGRPVDRANHPRLSLQPLRMEKLDPAGAGTLDYPLLTAREFGLAVSQIARLLDAGNAAWNAYRPLLDPLWSQEQFPDGPLPQHHALPLLVGWAAVPVLTQYLYAAAADLTLAWNEVRTAAGRFDAECAPDEARFPRHVLLGDPVTQPRASTKAPKTVAEAQAFDAAALTGGPGPDMPPVQRHHYFVPSPLHGCGTAAQLQSLFHRFVLIAQSYQLKGLVGSPLRITPSRDGAAPLGDRAIPAWLGFAPGGDLHANWSWSRAMAGLRSTVSAYVLTGDDLTRHPLLFRDDATDFLRVEGHVGLPLGTAIGRLITQKRQLGLSFGMTPVYLGSGGTEDEKSRAAAAAVMQRVLLCQLRELDVIFLTLMAGLFAFMVWIVRTLGPVDAKGASKTDTAPPAPAGNVVVGRLALTAIAGLRFTPITLDLEQEKVLTRTSETKLQQIRDTRVFDKTLVKDIATEAGGDAAAQKTAVAQLYDRVRDKAAGGELIDRVKIAVAEADPTADPAAIYPAVALMARAEDMMAATSAKSLAEFDQANFTTALRGLADAYESYADKAETDPAKAGADTAAANQAIVDNRSTIAAAASQLGGQAITAEVGRLLQEMFDKQTLEAYATRHPGLEHKGGVPVGGTLVLLYLHRDALAAAVAEAMRAVLPVWSTAFKKLTGQSPPDPAQKEAVDAMLKASVPQSTDPLEEFVVVGDLCLPTLCCEAECAEGEIFDRMTGVKTITAGDRPSVVTDPAPVEPTVPSPPADSVRGGTTTDTQPSRDTSPLGPVIRGGTPGGVLARGGTLAGSAVVRQGTVDRPAAGIVLSVRSASTGAVQSEDLPADGSFSLSLAAGEYAVSASVRGQSSKTQSVTITAGKTSKVSLVIAL